MTNIEIFMSINNKKDCKSSSNNSGGPRILEQLDLEQEVVEAEVLGADEALHANERSGAPPETSEARQRPSFMTEADVKILRDKHVFLRDFSDVFIKNTPIGDLMKIESTAMKARELERAKDAEDKLAINKMALASTYTNVGAGRDNRWSALHEGRFLGGACCSTAKLWLAAREKLGLSFPPPVGNYDMGSIGLAGYVSAKGWTELANPASTKLSIKMFSINSSANRSSNKKTAESDDEFLDISEFKLALRVMRTALSLIMPWNYSVAAIEGFFHQNNFCHAELANVEKKAAVLARFTDYVLAQNSDRWRDSEPFINTGELKTTWAAFFGAQPQASSSQKSKKQQGGKGSHQKAADPKLALGICFSWNLGQCLKPAGSCTTSKGRPLKHICDHVADPAKPTEVCGKDHIRKDFHK
jgi:hypothetical protein